MCVSGHRQFGKTNAPWPETQGHRLDVACVEGYQTSIFFCLNDKPNCDPFNTRTDNLKDIHLGGLFIYMNKSRRIADLLQGALQHD